jgi:hypothetical protein
VKDQAAEATIAAVAQKFTVAGGSTAVLGGLTANEIAAFTGALVAVIGLLVQWYYKRKDDRRKDELHRWRMSDVRDDE